LLLRTTRCSAIKRRATQLYSFSGVRTSSDEAAPWSFSLSYVPINSINRADAVSIRMIESDEEDAVFSNLKKHHFQSHPATDSNESKRGRQHALMNSVFSYERTSDSHHDNVLFHHTLREFVAFII
jgi:hypothetical protein